MATLNLLALPTYRLSPAALGVFPSSRGSDGGNWRWRGGVMLVQISPEPGLTPVWMCA
jgi:hypothetical protein